MPMTCSYPFALKALAMDGLNKIIAPDLVFLGGRELLNCVLGDGYKTEHHFGPIICKRYRLESA